MEEEQCASTTLLDSVQDNGKNPISTNTTVIDENPALINPNVADKCKHSIMINPTVDDTQYLIDPSLLSQSHQKQPLGQSSEQLEESTQLQKTTQKEKGPKEMEPQKEHTSETPTTTKIVQQNQQGHSYGTRFANQKRSTPGIEAVEMEKYICPKCSENRPYIDLLKDECPLPEPLGIDPKASMIVKHTNDECSNSTQKNNSYCGGEVCYLQSKNLDSKTFKGVESQTQKPVSSPFVVTKESKKVPSQVHSKFTLSSPPPSSKTTTNKVLNASMKSHLVTSSSKLQSTNVNGVQSIAGVSATNNNNGSSSGGAKTAIAKKSGQGSIKKLQIQAKKPTNSLYDSNLRALCTLKFKEIFVKKYKDLDQKDDLPKSDDTIDQLGGRLAQKLEEAIHDAFATKNDKEPLGQPYKSKFRNLHTSLGHPKNDRLLTNVVKGDIPIVKLVQMTPEELANPEQKSLMVKVRRESMQQSVLKAEDMGPRIKKTHKGEYIIVGDFLDSSKNDSSSTSSPQQDKNTPTLKSTSSISISPTRPKINIEDLIPKRKTSLGSDIVSPATATSITISPTIAINNFAAFNNNDSSKDDTSILKSTENMETKAAVIYDKETSLANSNNGNNNKEIKATDNYVNIKKKTVPIVSNAIMNLPQQVMDSPPYSPGALSSSVSSSFGSPSKTPPGEPQNNAITEPITVWKGRLLYDGVARFSGQASLVAAKKLDKVRNWDEYLAASIRVNGHVSRVEQADTYLIDCWCSPSKDVVFIKFEVDDTFFDKQQFDSMFNYLRYSPKDKHIRYGRVANTYTTVRELYLIPIEPEDKIPDVVTFLEYDEILIPQTDGNKRDSKLLLGAIVIVEAESGKLKRPRDVSDANANHISSKGGNRLDKKEKSHHDEPVKSISGSNKQNEKPETDTVIKSQQNATNPTPQSLQPPNSQKSQHSYTNNLPVISASNGEFSEFFQTLLANSNIQNIAQHNLPTQNLSATTGHYNAQLSPFNNTAPSPISFNQSHISIPSPQPQAQQYSTQYPTQYQTAIQPSPLQNNQHSFIPTHHGSPGLQAIPSPPAYSSYDQYYSQTTSQPIQDFGPRI
ncbi:474_t:CDS:2 [Entrophospora sp. SA101]|nr:474_t:CDS:2 [Entrophospora sp. SA101]